MKVRYDVMCSRKVIRDKAELTLRRWIYHWAKKNGVDYDDRTCTITLDEVEGLALKLAAPEWFGIYLVELY